MQQSLFFYYSLPNLNKNWREYKDKEEQIKIEKKLERTLKQWGIVQGIAWPERLPPFKNWNIALPSKSIEEIRYLLLLNGLAKSLRL